MSARAIVAIVAVAGVALCGLVTSVINQQIVTKVNERLPKESQFSAVGWYYTKSRRLHREYRRLFPSGRLLWAERAFGVTMAGFCICLVWAIGFFQQLFGLSQQ